MVQGSDFYLIEAGDGVTRANVDAKPIIWNCANV
jgi:hypothetical protein